MTVTTTKDNQQYLVLTAIGQNKTGLVSELSGLVSECNCNVVDSKMAIFGSEFTVIMLLAGDNASLVQLEMQLPPLAMQLNLLTMMKRTTKHQGIDKPLFLLTINGPDQAGTIQKLTSYLAKKNIDVASLKSAAHTNNEGDEWQNAQIRIELPEEVPLDKLQQGLEKECQKLNVSFSLNPITIKNT